MDLRKIKEKLCQELEEAGKKIEKSDNLSAGDLEYLYKLTDTVKNIDKIEMLEESGYSRDGDWDTNGTYTGGGGASYARRRDSRGRYARDNYSRDGYPRYSRDDAKSHMMEQLEDLMGSASTEREREALRRCMEQIEKA